MAKKPGIVESATATDEVEADVIKGPGEPAQETQGASPAAVVQPPVVEPPATTNAAQGGALGLPVSQIVNVEHAAQVLKAKTSLLHTVVHNMGHYSSLAFGDAEQLLADIGYLTNFIRSKV